MKLDSYDIKARLFPGLLSSLPFVVLHFYFLRPFLGQFWSQLLGIQMVSDVTILLAFLFLLTQLSRYISKELFENRLYADALAFPSTQFLLHRDSTLSPEYKAKVHERFSADLGIQIPTPDQEHRDSEHSRRLIAEAVSHARLYVGEGRLVGQHNAEYGFARNLAGGAVIALAVSLFDVVVFGWLAPERIALWVSVSLVGVYLLILLFARAMIEAFGRTYAKVLILEYMASSGGSTTS